MEKYVQLLPYNQMEMVQGNRIIIEYYSVFVKDAFIDLYQVFLKQN